MKVETPQILWNSEGDKGVNAALNSVALLESGLAEHTGDNGGGGSSRLYGNVMVTAGNTNVINLWKLTFPEDTDSDGERVTTTTTSTETKIDYLCSLTRQEQSVNTVAFSPDGLHLATGGETGAIVVWSVPPSKRGNGNGRHYWSTIEREQDLTVKVVSRSGDGVCDISWSSDSKRFIAGTIDHTVLVCEDKNFDANQKGDSPIVDSEWQVVWYSDKEHTHFVQGVAYDPRGTYLASMGSDRTVRVFHRKSPPKSKKKVLRPANAGSNNDCLPPVEHQRMVDQLLTESKIEVGKAKQIKFRKLPVNTTEELGNTTGSNNGIEGQPKPQRSCLYADEATQESFFRRLCWTIDGAFLVTPAALWHPEPNSSVSNEKSTPSFAAYLFARHKFDEPFKVLSGLEKPSVVVRPNPLLFKLPGPCESGISASMNEESKENQSPANPRGLPYRSIFAILTTDTILVYDTHHSRPLAVVRGLHYAGLSDCQWSADGTKLIVTSIDGYVSIVRFQNGELGEMYSNPLRSVVRGSSRPETSILSPRQCIENSSNVNPSSVLVSCTKTPKPKNEASSLIPPCEPGQTATLEAPPSKRHKKTRITPTLISGALATAETTASAEHVVSNDDQSTATHTKRPADEVLDETVKVGEEVTKLTLDNEKQPKKKKRIQPMLVSAGN